MTLEQYVAARREQLAEDRQRLADWFMAQAEAKQRRQLAVANAWRAAIEAELGITLDGCSVFADELGTDDVPVYGITMMTHDGDIDYQQPVWLECGKLRGGERPACLWAAVDGGLRKEFSRLDDALIWLQDLEIEDQPVPVDDDYQPLAVAIT